MKSLKMRFMLLVLLPVILIFSAIGTYTIVQFYQKQTESALQITEALTELYAGEIENELTEALNLAETMSEVITAQINSGHANRDAVNAILQNILLANEGVFGVWLVMEPDTFDGLDRFFANRAGYDSTGRFTPYWYRDGQLAALNYIEDYDTDGANDYYKLAFQSGKPQILEPYEEEEAGLRVLMTSISVPIRLNGKVVGVTGVDITTERLEEITAELMLYSSGFGRLFTDTGFLIYHPDKTRKGKIADEFLNSEGRQILSSAQNDKIFTRWAESAYLKTNSYQTYIPIKIGDLENRWVFGGLAVQSEMFAEVFSVLWKLIAVTAVGFVILGILILLVAGSITKPIQTLTVFIASIAGLDLRSANKEPILPLLKKRDEVGQIARGLDQMQGSLVEVTTQIQDISSRVAGGSQEIASAVEENSAAIEEVSSSMGELGSNVARSTEGAVNMTSDAKTVENLAFDGNQQMSKTLQAMDEIVKLSQNSRQALSTLASHVSSMEGILNIIADVADQTNLLALNAAIEAARAGEAGRGFAVVADEVRGLAEQTRKSVEEINHMVSQLVQNASESTRLMDGTEQQIQAGNSLLGQTEVAFNQITDRINAVGRSIGDFSVTLGDINEMGTSVAAASEEQAASMGEIARGAEDLAKLGEQLQGIAKRFVL